MRVSELLQSGVDEFLELTPLIQAHLEDTDNPHNVTGENLADNSITGSKLVEGSISPAHLSKQTTEMFDGKVDKEEGKQLSQNDFTDEYREKLDVLSKTDFVKKAEPITLSPAVGHFKRLDDTMVLSNITKFIFARQEDSINTFHMAYRTTDDIYTVKRFYHPPKKTSATILPAEIESLPEITVTAPADMVCHAVTKDATYFAKQDSETEYIHIYRRLLSDGDGEATFFKAFMLPYSLTSVPIFIQEFHVNPENYFLFVFRLKQQEKIAAALYATNQASHWDILISCKNEDTEDGSPISYQYYDRRFPLAALDVNGNAYIAPTWDYMHNASVWKINPAGEVEKYYNIGDFKTAFTRSFMDVSMMGERLYAWSQTGVMGTPLGDNTSYPLFPSDHTNYFYNRGVSPRRDGRIFSAIYAFDSNLPACYKKTILSCIDARTFSTPSSIELLEGQIVLDETYDLMRLHGDEIWGFLYNSTDKTLSIHKFQYTAPISIEAADNV